MSFTSWLQNLRSALAPRRGRRQRRCSARAATHRLNVEVLEDRLTPSFYWGGLYPIDEFNQTAPNFPFALDADFNGDGWQDLFSVSSPGMGDILVGSVFLGQADGTFVLEESWGLGGADIQIAGAGEINGDGRPDLAIKYWDSSVVGGFNVMVLLNDGIWPNSPQLGIGGASVTEGNAGVIEAVFTVTLENGPSQPVTVRYATADGGATAGADYEAASGTLTFEPGETSKTITVLVSGDRIPESDYDRVFFVNLSESTNAVIARTQGRGVIVDDEPIISVADAASVAEGNAGTRSASFTVTLSVAYDLPVAVNYVTADGTAAAGSDYQAASGTLTFAPGETSKTVNVLVNGDRLPEPNETFLVNLSDPTYATITDGQAVGTITDDEPRISIGDMTKKEGNGKKTTLFTFTVTLSAAYDQPVTMSFRTVDGTATTSDQDYIAKTGTLTFAPGETTKTITIEVKGDSKREANETFYLDLFGNSSNALFTKNRGLGTILNDD